MITMASVKENQNYSQFFFTLDKCSNLNGKYTLFGRVCDDSLWFINELNSLKTD